MTNQEFLSVISLSFKTFLETNSRSNKKLKVLHGAIAKDFQNRLGENFSIAALGFENGKECKIKGRYIDKQVDITICRNNVPISGIGVKFVMQNYSQNSNNYFENMLGETANIRCSRVPYFQILIIPDRLPYYKKGGEFKKWEVFSEHNSEKYLMLSKDNVDAFLHTPTKTLLAVVHIPDMKTNPKTRREYAKNYSGKNLNIRFSENDYGAFSPCVVFNNYETFAEKVVHFIKSL